MHMNYGPSEEELGCVAVFIGGAILLVGGIAGWTLRWLIYG